MRDAILYGMLCLSGVWHVEEILSLLYSWLRIYNLKYTLKSLQVTSNTNMIGIQSEWYRSQKEPPSP